MSQSEEWVFGEDEVAIRSGEPALAVDTERTVTYANERFLTYAGLSREDVHGAELSVLRRVVEDGFTRLSAAVDAVVRGRLSYEQVTLELCPGEGAVGIPTEARVTPVVDEMSLAGALVVLRDVTDEQLRQQEAAETYQRYETLVDQSRDGVTITQDGTNVFVDDQFAEMLGYAKDDLVGASFLKPIAPSEYHTVQQRHRRRMQGEYPPSRYELELRTKTGDPVHVEISVSRVQYGGEPAVMATYRDITARKQREEDLERFRRAIETAPHAIFLTDSDGTITYVNPAFEDVTGYAREDALGEPPAILSSGEMPETFYDEMWDTLTAGEVWEGYLTNRRASGDLYYTHETIAPITDGDGEIREFVAIQTDVTERVERERLVDTLDRVLRHNLRNRLNVIEAHGDLIRAKQRGVLAGHVDKILQSVDDLLETTQKGREIIKFLSRPARNQPKDAVATVCDAVDSVRENHPDADIQVDLPAEAYVAAVPEVGDAFEELLENAIEHNDRRPPEVAVSVDVDGETVRVCIADNGPGISEMERRVVDETQDIDQLYHGSGFGLWLVYWIVRQSRGTISIADRTPRGSVVTLEFDRMSGVESVDRNSNKN